jgi:hypothetical protein
MRNDATMVSTDEKAGIAPEGSSTHQKVSEYSHSRGKRVTGIPQWSSLHPVPLTLVKLLGKFSCYPDLELVNSARLADRVEATRDRYCQLSQIIELFIQFFKLR